MKKIFKLNIAITVSAALVLAGCNPTINRADIVDYASFVTKNVNSGITNADDFNSELADKKAALVKKRKEVDESLSDIGQRSEGEEKMARCLQDSNPDTFATNPDLQSLCNDAVASLVAEAKEDPGNKEKNDRARKAQELIGLLFLVAAGIALASGHAPLAAVLAAVGGCALDENCSSGNKSSHPPISSVGPGVADQNPFNDDVNKLYGNDENGYYIGVAKDGKKVHVNRGDLNYSFDVPTDRFQLMANGKFDDCKDTSLEITGGFVTAISMITKGEIDSECPNIVLRPVAIGDNSVSVNDADI